MGTEVLRFGLNRNEHTTAHRFRNGRWVAMSVDAARGLIQAGIAIPDMTTPDRIAAAELALRRTA